MKKHLLMSAALIGILNLPAGSHAATHSVAAADAAPEVVQTTDGEVRKIDREARKITIRHAELKHLGMPAMTMVFQVTDPSMLDQVKQGDKVTFVAEKMGGQFTVTRIEAKR